MKAKFQMPNFRLFNHRCPDDMQGGKTGQAVFTSDLSSISPKRSGLSAGY